MREEEMIPADAPCRVIRVTVLWAVCALIVGQAFPSLAAAQEQPEPPQLRILTRPIAPLWQMDIDSEQNFLVASQIGGDALLVSLKQRREPEPILLPIAIREPRRGIGVGISASGDRIALAAPLDENREFAVYLVERRQMATRKLASWPPEEAGEANVLRFARLPSNGREVVVGGLAGPGGVRVWDAETGETLFSDPPPLGAQECASENGCATRTVAIRLDVASQQTGYSSRPIVMAAGGRWGLRTYVLDEVGKLQPSNMLSTERLSEIFETEGDELRVTSLAFEPNGGRLAVAITVNARETDQCGIMPSPRVAILDARTFEVDRILVAKSPAYRSVPCYLSQVAWSKDGSFLYAGGYYFVDGSRFSGLTFGDVLPKEQLATEDARRCDRRRPKG
jgi:hypothetical protein